MATIDDVQLIDYIQLNAAMGEKAAAIEAGDAERRRKCAASVPGVVDALIGAGQVDPTDRDALARKLADDHGFVLDALQKVASRLQAVAASKDTSIGSLGGPARRDQPRQKAASTQEYRGGSRSSETPPSYRTFARNFGLEE